MKMQMHSRFVSIHIKNLRCWYDIANISIWYTYRFNRVAQTNVLCCADVCNRKILMFQTQHIYGPGAAWLCFILFMMSQNDVIKHQSDTSVYCRCYKLQYMYARRWMQ